MKLQLRKFSWLFVILLFLLSNSMPVIAAVYWASASGVPVEQGIRSKYISVCFIGDAVTSRPDRVKQIVTYIKEFEYAANIRFVSLSGNRLEDEASMSIKNLACSPPMTQLNGNDYYNGDIRVLIFTSGSNKNIFSAADVPGKGCTQKNPPSSWSNAPWDLTPNRACLYNLKLGDDPFPNGITVGAPRGNPPSSVPYLNHALHEFGHALGLAHENERKDANAPCTEKGYGGGISAGLMTPYDRRSVMHYQFLSCGINGNYDNTGLSDWDKLALHILYPEDDFVAEYIGTTVVRTTDTLTLQSDWKARGANINFVAKDFDWKLQSTSVSTVPDLSTGLKDPGDYVFQFTHSDFLGRKYSHIGIIHVLSPENYNKQIAAPIAARLPIT